MVGFFVCICTFSCILRLVSLNPLGTDELYADDKDEAFVVDENRGDELDKLKELLGSPTGDATIISKVRNGAARRSKVGLNCNSLEKKKLGTSSKLVALRLCPRFREKEYSKHANRVAQILQHQTSDSDELEKQKKEFIKAVNQMAHAAGNIPSLGWA